MWGWALAVLCVCAAAAVAFWRLRPRPEADDGMPYARRDRLMSPTERAFLAALDEAVLGDYRIFPDVPVADVLRVTRPAQSSAFGRALGRIVERQFDFVLCEHGSLAIACAIDLDDSSHRDVGQPLRDEFLIEACRAAGMPFLRVQARHQYDTAALRTQLLQAIASGRPLNASADLQVNLEPARYGPSAGDVVPQFPPVAGEAPPPCPHCGGPTVRRALRTGLGRSGEVWSCAEYPACRGVVPIRRDAPPRPASRGVA